MKQAERVGVPDGMLTDLKDAVDILHHIPQASSIDDLSNILDKARLNSFLVHHPMVMLVAFARTNEYEISFPVFVEIVFFTLFFVFSRYSFFILTSQEIQLEYLYFFWFLLFLPSFKIEEISDTVSRWRIKTLEREYDMLIGRLVSQASNEEEVSKLEEIVDNAQLEGIPRENTRQYRR